MLLDLQTLPQNVINLITAIKSSTKYIAVQFRGFKLTICTEWCTSAVWKIECSQTSMDCNKIDRIHKEFQNYMI